MALFRLFPDDPGDPVWDVDVEPRGAPERGWGPRAPTDSPAGEPPGLFVGREFRLRQGAGRRLLLVRADDETQARRMALAHDIQAMEACGGTRVRPWCDPKRVRCQELADMSHDGPQGVIATLRQ